MIHDIERINGEDIAEIAADAPAIFPIAFMKEHELRLAICVDSAVILGKVANAHRSK